MTSKAYAKQFSALLSNSLPLMVPLAAFSGYGRSVILTDEKNKQFSSLLP